MKPAIRGIGRALLLLALLVPVAEAATPRRVLILHSFGRDFAPFNFIATAFRTELAHLLSGAVVFHKASFDVERGGPPEDERPIIDFLLNRYGDAHPDLVVTVGAPALRFHLRSRPRLFPQTPLQRWGIAESRLPDGAEVRFRPPSLWEQHKLLILAGAGIVLFQVTLITALLFQRVRRRHAEKESVDLSGRAREHASLVLASMRERVRLLEGELAIESAPGRGTTVVAWVPS